MARSSTIECAGAGITLDQGRIQRWMRPWSSYILD
jgi:hypothetical protein